jgi:hypothetical protein
MTIEELQEAVDAGEDITYGEVAYLLIGQEVVGLQEGENVPINFKNCNLTVNGNVDAASHIISISNGAVLYNPILGGN